MRMYVWFSSEKHNCFPPVPSIVYSGILISREDREPGADEAGRKPVFPAKCRRRPGRAPGDTEFSQHLEDAAQAAWQSVPGRALAAPPARLRQALGAAPAPPHIIQNPASALARAPGASAPGFGRLGPV